MKFYLEILHEGRGFCFGCFKSARTNTPPKEDAMGETVEIIKTGQRGIVTSWEEQKGYGTIDCNGEEVFVHFTSILLCDPASIPIVGDMVPNPSLVDYSNQNWKQFINLPVDAPVTFDVALMEKDNPQAINVRVCDFTDRRRLVDDRYFITTWDGERVGREVQSLLTELVDRELDAGFGAHELWSTISRHVEAMCDEFAKERYWKERMAKKQDHN
jgi:hypothetical protein